MRSSQIMKWFVDHNEILKVKEDVERRNYLTFLACVLLKVDEEASFDDFVIKINCTLEDYSFDSDTELFLKCLNKLYGYSETFFWDIGFIKLKNNNITSFRGKYSDLYDMFHLVIDACGVYKDYDFDKAAYYNGRNTFFYPKDLEFSDEEKKLLDRKYSNQDTFEVFRSNGSLVIY